MATAIMPSADPVAALPVPGADEAGAGRPGGQVGGIRRRRRHPARGEHPERERSSHRDGAAADRDVPRRRAGTTPAGLTALRQQIRVLNEAIAAQLEQHPDPNIFTSLPRSGTVRAARLLAEIGAPAAGSPTPEALTCLAGAAPRRRLQGPAPGVELPSPVAIADVRAGWTSLPYSEPQTASASADISVSIDVVSSCLSKSGCSGPCWRLRVAR